MQRLEVSGAIRPIYGSLGVKRLNWKWELWLPILIHHTSIWWAVVRNDTKWWLWSAGPGALSRVQNLHKAKCSRRRRSLQMSHTLMFGRPCSMGITEGKARGQQIGILLGYSKFRLDRVTPCNYERDRVPYSPNLVCFSSLLRLLFSTTERIVRYNLSCLYWYEFTSV